MSSDNEHIAGRGEFAIGFGDNPAYEISASTANLINEKTLQVERHILQSRNILQEQIDSCYRAGCEAIGNCEACITGGIDRILDKVNATVSKADDKIAFSIDNRIREAGGQIAIVNDAIIAMGGEPVLTGADPVLAQSAYEFNLTGDTSPLAPPLGGGGTSGTSGKLQWPDFFGKILTGAEADAAGCPAPSKLADGSSAPIFQKADGSLWEGRYTPPDSSGHGGVMGQQLIPCGGPPVITPGPNMPQPPQGQNCIPICGISPTPPPACPPCEEEEDDDDDEGPGDDSCSVTLPQELADAGFTIDGPPEQDDSGKGPTPEQEEAYQKWQEENKAAKAKCEDKGVQASGNSKIGAFCDPKKVEETAKNIFGGSGGLLEAINTSPDAAGMNTGTVSVPFLGMALPVPTGIFNNAAQGVWSGIVNSLAQGLGTIINQLPTPAGCNTGGYATAVGRRALGNFLGGWFNLTPPTTQKFLDQQLNYVCPTGTLSSADLTAAYIGNCVDEQVWKDGLALNGDCHQWYQITVDASKDKLDVQTAITAWRADCLDDEKLVEMLKRNGVYSEETVKTLKEITRAIPQMPDLVRFMVRDVLDKNVYEKFEYDKGFDRKFIGKIQEWAKRHGVDEEIAILYWRAHWEIPSPTALYEMLFRLRPPEGEDTGHPSGIVLTEEEIENALLVNDMAPKFVKPMMAISAAVMTRTDVIRGYTIGEIEESDLVRRFRDLKYNKEDAEVLKKFTVRDSANRRADLTGQINASQLSAMFIRDELREDEFRIRLLDLGYPGEVVDNYVRSATTKRQARDTQKSLTVAKRAYLRGRMDDDQYKMELLSIQIDPSRIEAIVARDRMAKSLQDKAIAIAKLCKMVEQGFLSANDYLERAVNLGYKHDNAMLLLSSCNEDIRQRREKLLAKEMKQAQKTAREAVALQRKRERNANQEYRERFPYKLPPKKLAPEGVVVPVPANDEPKPIV